VEHGLGLSNIDVELHLTEALPAVSADMDQLQQVVLNLLTNAIDAMPYGGRLSLKTEAVQANGQQYVELRVEDSGVGIAPEFMDKLFEPFFTTKTEGDGVGLGLAICHGIIEAHGGSIRAESNTVAGTTFIVQLPLEHSV
jgi:signal transduction histidine kinase